jgi:uncharacterized membrane protein
METNHENNHPRVAVDKNMMAIFAYLFILILVPLLTEAKNDPFVKYHLKQGLVLVIFDVIGWLLGSIFVMIPFVGALIMWLWWIVSLVFAIIGILNVVQGHEKELPFIGEYGRNFKF